MAVVLKLYLIIDEVIKLSSHYISKIKFKIALYFSDYMNLENTNSIKGIFVWLIIFCHKSGYGIKMKYLYIKILGYFGQKVVSMFLFYSGFGIYESIKKKGKIYIKTIPRKATILFIKYQIIL